LKTSSVLSLVAVVTVVISLLSIWFYPSVHDFMAANTMWNGISNFRDEFGADYSDTLEDLPELPENHVMVSIPYLEYGEEDLAKISKFVTNGGILLLMDDYGYGNDILEYLGMDARFSNIPLLDPLFCFKNQWMPKITDFAGNIANQELEVVILNNATTLTGLSRAETLAYSSGASYLDSNENESQSDNEPAGPFSVAGILSVEKGLVILVSDPSVMISGMIGRDDNFRFIHSLVYMKGEPESFLIDRSHLSKTPLDTSKISLAGIREIVANPYTLVGVIALVFVVLSTYTIRKGETVG